MSQDGGRTTVSVPWLVLAGGRYVPLASLLGGFGVRRGGFDQDSGELISSLYKEVEGSFFTRL